MTVSDLIFVWLNIMQAVVFWIRLDLIKIRPEKGPSKSSSWIPHIYKCVLICQISKWWKSTWTVSAIQNSLRTALKFPSGSLTMCCASSRAPLREIQSRWRLWMDRCQLWWSRREKADSDVNRPDSRGRRTDKRGKHGGCRGPAVSFAGLIGLIDM